MRTTVLLLLLASLVGGACSKLGLCKDIDLTVPHTPFTGTQFRTDSYYYGDPYTQPGQNGGTFYETLIFYRNGVVLHPGVSEVSKLDQYIRSVERSTRLSPTPFRATRAIWGLFVLDKTDIQLEYWQPTDCGAYTVKGTGTILNDTTFLLQTRRKHYPDSRGIEESTVSLRFVFRPFAPKPDSTNDFL